jgi:hypothetical protein
MFLHPILRYKFFSFIVKTTSIKVNEIMHLYSFGE